MRIYNVIHYELLNNRLILSSLDKEEAYTEFKKKKKDALKGLQVWEDGKPLYNIGPDSYVEFRYDAKGRKRKKRIAKEFPVECL